MQRFVFSLVLAAVCAAVVSSRIYVDFERVRLRVISTPVQAGEQGLSVPLPDVRHLAASRTAIILRVRGVVEPTDLLVALDGRRLARITVPPHDEIRVDLAAQLAPGLDHELTLTGDRAGWQLAYLELANVHGFSQGVVDFVILPHERRAAGAFRPWVFLPVVIALCLLLPRPVWGTRRQRWLYWSAATVVLLLLAAALLADALSPYRIMLSLQTFLLCAAILYAEPIARLRRPLEPHVRRAVPQLVRSIRRWGPLLPYVALPVLMLWWVGEFYRPEVGFTELIKFGDQFSPTSHPALRQTPHAVEPGSGYDGQFYAQLVFDPLVRSQEIVAALDSPGYRARRILFPWAAYVLGLGHPWFSLQAYALLNVACWLATAWLLVRWLPPGSARRTAAWCGCLLAEGMLASIRQSLVDGPSMFLLALGVAAVEQNRRWVAAGLLGISGLGRDTNVIGGLTLAPAAPRARALLSLALQAVIVCAPLLLWMAYLTRIGLSPGETGYSNFALPFTALVHKWGVTTRELHEAGWDSYARFSFLSVAALTTQLIVLLCILDWRHPWWRMGIAYAGLMLVLGQAVWEGYPGAAGRVVLPMTFAFNILLPGVRWFWPLWVLGNASILVGLSALQVPWLWEIL